MNNREKEITKEIGWKFKKRREALKLSQEKVAKKLGITFQQVQKYENGSNRISSAKLAIISEILEVSVSYFYDDSFLIESKLPPEERNLVLTYQSLEKKDKKHLKHFIELLVK